jgi:hypothetical protein
VAVVLADHFQILVAEQFAEVFEIVWVLHDKLRREGPKRSLTRSCSSIRNPSPDRPMNMI